MKKTALLFIITLISFSGFSQNEGDKILGKWLTGDQKAHIEIFKNGEKYFGKIVWLKESLDANGKPRTDVENPDEKLRSRPMINLNLLTNFEYDEDGEYEDGEIYNTRDGKTYSCNMDLDGDILEVRGYVGISLLGKTETWTRVK